MKKIIFILVLFVFFSCHKKDQYEKCTEFKATTKQYSYAISNYQDFEGYAQFYKKIVWDSIAGKNVELPLSYGFDIGLKELNDLCLPNNLISFYNIKPKINDTFLLNKIYKWDFPLDTPYADYVIADYDASIDDYIIVPQKEHNSWLVLQSVNEDTTFISGSFQMVVSRLHPDRRKDDPLRPDTLHFVHGYFRAEFYQYE
ncbi:MAG TPA: hypothetical protein ENK91_08025 [Bacteroidetes bacterium]|nr:hypothetical protein [Bacteroidota bacterium]